MSGKMLVWMLPLLWTLAGVVSSDGPDAELLLRTLTKLMVRATDGTSTSTSAGCNAAAQSWRDPSLTLTLKQATLDDINDLLANSLGAPIHLLGLAVPTLDPLVVDKFDVSTTDPTLGDVTIRVKGVQVKDLSTLRLRSVKLNVLEPPLNFQLSVELDDVRVLSSDYYLNLSIADTLSFYGSGAMWFQANGIKLYADIDLKTLSLSALHINELVLSIDKFASYFENLMGGGETGALINDVLGTIVPDLAQGLADIIKGVINGNTTTTAGTATTPSV